MQEILKYEFDFLQKKLFHGDIHLIADFNMFCRLLQNRLFIRGSLLS